MKTKEQLEADIAVRDEEIDYLRVHRDITDCKLREARRNRESLKEALKALKRREK
jgi:hypothetical protein